MVSKTGWIKTNGFITIVCDGKPTSIAAGTDEYKAVLALTKKNDRKGIEEFLSLQKRLPSYTKDDFKIKDSKVVDRNDKEVHPFLAERLIDFSRNDYAYKALRLFNKNLEMNPDPRSRDQLYTFLERHKVPIMSDGCFLAYKYVTVKGDDLVDSHSGTFKNNPGCVPAMDRDKCNSDPNTECAPGLHVAAYDYASKCGAGQVIICVKVNPKDVVSVPKDSGFSKIRTCRYEVICRGSEEVKKSYVGAKFILGKDVVKETITQDEIDLYSLSGQEIINMVHKQTGVKIHLSPKSKKSVIKKAREILSKHGLRIHKNTADLRGLSGTEIIAKVKELTGEKIKISPKSKQRVLKYAIEILEKNNFKVVKS